MITIILQGPYNKECLESYICLLNKNVEIIVSCWESCRISKDLNPKIKIIKNIDPGVITVSTHKTCNLSRQIVSTKNALKESCGDIVAKIRSDLRLENPDRFLNLMYKSNKKIKVINYSTIDPFANNLPLLYHPCDWVYISDKDVLKKMFDIEIPNDGYFYAKYKNTVFPIQFGKYSEAIRSEAYIASNLLNKSFLNLNCTLQNPSHFSKVKSNIRLVKNFELYNLKEMGLKSIKHNTNNFDTNRFTKLGYKLWKKTIKNRKYKITLNLYYVTTKIIFYAFASLKKYVKYI